MARHAHPVFACKKFKCRQDRRFQYARNGFGPAIAFKIDGLQMDIHIRSGVNKNGDRVYGTVQHPIIDNKT